MTIKTLVQQLQGLDYEQGEKLIREHFIIAKNDINYCRTMKIYDCDLVIDSENQDIRFTFTCESIETAEENIVDINNGKWSALVDGEHITA